MGDFRLPPIRFDSAPFSSRALSDTIDWGLLANGIPDQWAKTKGEGIRVVVLDTGLPDHYDLPEPYFTPLNFTSSPLLDSNGHQTHCMGIIGARANGRGVIGVAPACQMGAIKVLGDNGSGSSAGIAKGIIAAVDNGADIISMSLGGGYDKATELAVKYAVSKGVLVFAAAGNSGYSGQNTVDYPGKLADTICVASYRRDGQISRFSSGGKEVDLAAPGEQITSTWPGGKIRVLSGTSMATPFAAAVAALMLSADPDNTDIRTPKGFRAAIKAAAIDQGPIGPDDSWGIGIVDPAKAIKAPNPVDDYWFFR